MTPTAIGETKKLVLSHEHSVFTFEFAALDYINPGKNRYAYRLEGVDRDWIETDSDMSTSGSRSAAIRRCTTAGMVGSSTRPASRCSRPATRP